MLKPWAALILSLALLLAMRQPRTGAAQSNGFAVSPEEAVISLLPYRLLQADLPGGYTPDTPSALVPAIEAAAGAEPVRQLAQYTRDGVVVGFSQGLSRAAGSSLPDAELIVYLMAGADAARSYTTDPSRQPAAGASSRVEPVIPGVPTGDVSSTWHLAATIAQGNSQGGYEVRWARGQLVFIVITLTSYGQEKLDDVRALVAATDKRATAAGPPALGAPTVTPPADESGRLDAALKLRHLLVPATDAPAGFQLRGAGFTHPALAVLRSNSPQRTLATLDERFRRVLGVEEVFSSGRAATTALVGLFVNQDADPTSALFDLQGSGTPSDAVDPPLMLGDRTIAFQYRSTQPDGSPIDDLDVYWLHGALVFNAEMVTAAGAIDTQSLAAFMQLIDAAYQGSVYAVAPAAPTALRATALNATTIRLDWIDPDALADGYAIVGAEATQVLATTGANATTFTATDLLPGTTYCFQVFGFDPAGASELSQQACATTPAG